MPLSNRRVVVTGLGAVTPVGNDVNTMWNNLINGKSGIALITRFDVSEYSTKIGGEVKNFDPLIWMDKKDVQRNDLFVHYATASSEMAIKDSGLDLNAEYPFNVGVIIGSGIGGLSTFEDQHDVLREKGPKRISPFFIPMLIADMASGYVSIRIGARGPNYCTVSACSSGAHAIGVAFRTIQYGEADVIICGGSEATIRPLALAGFCSAHALSKRNDEPERASRPFDLNRDGFVMSEGAGIIILEELNHAKKRNANIYAELVGYASTADAYHITAPSPDGEGAYQCMAKAIKDANISLDLIDYINAHGTSTKANDSTETLAIKRLFGERAYKIPVNSTKSMIGHLLGASGAVEAITTILSVKNNLIHQTLNYETPDPECDLDYVPEGPREIPIRYALTNSFGFGGHNVSLVFKKFEG